MNSGNLFAELKRRNVYKVGSRRPTNGNGLPRKLGFVSWLAMLAAHDLTPRTRATYWKRECASSQMTFVISEH